MKVIKVIERINKGGFGIIDKVQTDDGSILARKTFCPSNETLSLDAKVKLKKRFIREVKTQEMLPDNLFVPILYSELDDDTPWFLMPCAEKDYSKEIQESRLKKRPPEGLADILNSLEYLHRKGLVHRDLKPQNILFSEGIWKLADFGLITQDKTILTTTITTTDAGSMGTFMYSAPEQLNEFKTVRSTADIYSFGAILHDVFNGKPRTPFAHLSASGKIGFVIEKCTEEKPEKRFKDIGSLRKVLLSTLIDHTMSKNANVAEWSDKIQNSSTWDFDTFENFFYALKKNEDDLQQVFWYVDNTIIEHLYRINIELWDEFILIYFEWIRSHSFRFNYCDVLIGIVYKAYLLSSSIDVKAKAVLAASSLGSSHNRWYVMDIVMKMCSPTIDENLAERIAIELHIDGRIVKEHMINCATRINKKLSNYHPLIEKALDN